MILHLLDRLCKQSRGNPIASVKQYQYMVHAPDTKTKQVLIQNFGKRCYGDYKVRISYNPHLVPMHTRKSILPAGAEGRRRVIFRSETPVRGKQHSSDTYIPSAAT